MEHEGIGKKSESGEPGSSERHLTDWIDSYLQYVDNSEPPLSFKRWVAISTIASVLGRKCYLEWGDITFFPNLYIVLISPPGRARKSTAMEQGLRFIQDASIKVNLAAESLTREALIRDLRNSKDSYHDTEQNLNIIHSSMTVYSSELTSFVGFRNLQLISDLTDWYDCRRLWTYRTKGQGTDSIQGVFVNLIGATTPSQIHSALPQEAIGGGFTSRTIFIYEKDKEKSIALPMKSESELKLRELLLSDLVSISNIGGPFQVTESFLLAYEEWYNHQAPPFKDERFAGYMERRPTFILKLCIILCAARNNTKIITDHDLYKAIHFLQQAEEGMRYALSGTGESKSSGILDRIMLELQEVGTITFSQLLAAHMHDVSKLELEMILDSLQTIKFLTYVENTGVIKFNPNFEQDYRQARRPKSD
jgi:hypothetical protein